MTVIKSAAPLLTVSCVQACVLLTGLNKGLPQLGVGKSSKHRLTVHQLVQGRDQARGKVGDIEDMR